MSSCPHATLADPHRVASFRHWRPLPFVLAGAVSILLAACASGADDDAADDVAAETDAAEFELVTDGTLTVCTSVPFPPFEYEDPDGPSGFSGFDVELVAAIADELGLDIAVVDTGFEALTSGTAIVAGNCDVAAAAISITEERAAEVDFSAPYFTIEQSLLVPAGSPITGIDDLDEGMGVGAESGTTGEAYAQDNITGAEIRSFDDTGDLYLSLIAGTIDAVLHDSFVNQEYAEDGELVVVDTYPTDEQLGLVTTQDRDDGLMDAIDTALEALRADGTYDELVETFFGA